ncbi:MAG: hypothetical protein N2V74_01665 [Candidatus Methanospirare jalkutatii]|nr:MAG: hypothetical protein N2V74_04195 [Candidatus Methanospirare jalkutatii]UYZ40431.1 MAG: hypothetical protein N2V74_01665 [Candidatus Methanospirare jalkutatii]
MRSQRKGSRGFRNFRRSGLFRASGPRVRLREREAASGTHAPQTHTPASADENKSRVPSRKRVSAHILFLIFRSLQIF